MFWLTGLRATEALYQIPGRKTTEIEVASRDRQRVPAHRVAGRRSERAVAERKMLVRQVVEKVVLNMASARLRVPLQCTWGQHDSAGRFSVTRGR